MHGVLEVLRQLPQFDCALFVPAGLAGHRGGGSEGSLAQLHRLASGGLDAFTGLEDYSTAAGGQLAQVRADLAALRAPAGVGPVKDIQGPNKARSTYTAVARGGEAT